jgi:phage terminase large subunit GpA-like protein
MEAITDPNNGETVLMTAKQLMKTTIIENVIGYFIHLDPSPILVVQPSLDMAKKFSKKKIAMMIKACPVLRDRIGDARSRDSGNTVLVKMFPGGSLTIAGANSPLSFRQESMRVVIQDDIDGFPQSAGTEGDPCDLADGRAENYHDAIFIKASTPTVKGSSRIAKAFEATDQSYFYVPCLRCGCWQTLKWCQVRWPKDEPAKACYVCEGCKAELSDFERIRMITQGQWRPTVAHRRRRGFHLSGLYRMMGLKEKEFTSYLHQFAVQFLDAKHEGRESLKTWTNTFLAETWEEEFTKPIELMPLMKRAESYTPDKLPNGIIIAIAAVDVQKRWLQVEVLGLGMDDETWGIDTKLIEGDPDGSDVWEDLAELLSKTYTREDGVEIKIHATAIDMKSKGDRVVHFVKHGGVPRVYPVYGVPTGQTMLVTPRLNKHYMIRAYAVDSKNGKDILFARLAIDSPGPRYTHFPVGQGYNEEYFHQLTAEVLKTRYLHGFGTLYYEKIRDRNEALDIRVYLLAVVDILRPNLTTIAKKLKAPGEQVQPERPTQPPPPAPAPRQRIRVGMGSRPYSVFR